MADVFFRALCFIVFYCLLLLFNLNLSTLSSLQRHGINYGGYHWTNGVYHTNLQPSFIQIGALARRVGFHRTKLSLMKWTKRGQTSLVVAGHDPPLDITVFMDISFNPGPVLATNSQNGSRSSLQGYNLKNLHSPKPAKTTVSFIRDSPSHPITSLVSLRAHNNFGRRFTAVESRTLIDVPIVNSQYSAACSNSIKFCNLNTRSIKSKSADFVCYVKSCAADIFAITETWLTDKDCAHRAEVTPPGYKLYDHPRTGRTGGGTALMCRESITVTKVAVGEKRSFEFSEWIILGQGSRKIRIVIVYRLQYSPNHPVTTGVFFDEFSDYLESIILSSEPLLITGDFNIHVNVVGDPHKL